MFVSYQRTAEDVKTATRLLGTGLSDYEIGRRTGVSRSSIQRWRTRGAPQPVCDSPLNWQVPDDRSYSYLLGIYLGDGYIANVSARSPVLEISLDPRYPGIVDECSAAIQQVVKTGAKASLRTTPKGEAIRLVTTSRLWPLAFPQHGPGKKHERAIVLASWQQDIVDRFPHEFLRGLIHADGSRVVNRFKVKLASGSREYQYPRYFFTNLSADIRGLFCASCDRLEIRWTRSSYKNISIADRRSVAILDSFVGPKDLCGRRDLNPQALSSTGT
jgi:hypothetical protein